MASDPLSNRSVSAVLLSDDDATREAFERAVEGLEADVSSTAVTSAEAALEALPAPAKDERFREVPLAVIDAVSMDGTAVELLEALKHEDGRRRTPTLVLADTGADGGRALYHRNANAVVPWPPEDEPEEVLAGVLEFWLTVPALP